ncbi:MAG TPA: hypothetical protein PKJ34_13150 [Anaerolineaceae bacterium]|nr:hypothetical protein [Anaerolineaceae bacterium]
MKHTLFFIVMICLMLSSCSGQPSENAIQTAVSQTQAAQPTEIPITPTATVEKIDLKDLDLESLSFQDGDLPEEYTLSGDIKSIPATIDDQYKELLVNAIQIGFLHNKKAGGSVTVAILESNFDRNQVYEYLVSSEKIFTSSTDTTDIGEEGKIIYFTGTPTSPDSIKIIFTRCSSVVKISLARDVEESDVINYAQKLDERLSSAVCP